MPDATGNRATGPREDRLSSGSSTGGFRPLRSKLRPARSHLPLVPRVALVEALSRTRAPLILISAPAGAGKSTLLGQFAELDGRPVAWVQVDEADNDPIVLLTYLALALDAVTPVDDALFPLLRVRTPPVDEQILPGLCEALAQSAGISCSSLTTRTSSRTPTVGASWRSWPTTSQRVATCSSAPGRTRPSRSRVCTLPAA